MAVPIVVPKEELEMRVCKTLNEFKRGDVNEGQNNSLGLRLTSILQREIDSWGKRLPWLQSSQQTLEDYGSTAAP